VSVCSPETFIVFLVRADSSLPLWLVAGYLESLQ